MNLEWLLTLGMTAGTVAWWVGRRRTLQAVAGSSPRRDGGSSRFLDSLSFKSGPGSPQDPPEKPGLASAEDVIQEVESATAGGLGSGPGSPQDPPEKT